MGDFYLVNEIKTSYDFFEIPKGFSELIALAINDGDFYINIFMF